MYQIFMISPSTTVRRKLAGFAGRSESLYEFFGAISVILVQQSFMRNTWSEVSEMVFGAKMFV